MVRQILPRLRERPTRFITLTLRHSRTPLSDQLNRLYSCFAALRRRPPWKSSQTGAAAFCEIKIGDDGLWHVHLHVLAVGEFLDQRTLSREWHAVTGDSSIVDIRLVKKPSEIAHYVVKYVTKPLDPSVCSAPHRLDEAIVALRGRRLCNASGDFGKLNPEDATDGGDEDWVTVGRLDQLFDDAATGDRVALEIVKALTFNLDRGAERLHDKPIAPA